MKFRVEILPTAWEDLLQIEEYYTLEFDITTAIKVSDSILDSIARLEEYPEISLLTPDDWLNEQGYRMLIMKKYVAIIKNIDTIIYVYHIANTQTEYTKLFD